MKYRQNLMSNLLTDEQWEEVRQVLRLLNSRNIRISELPKSSQIFDEERIVHELSFYSQLVLECAKEDIELQEEQERLFETIPVSFGAVVGLLLKNYPICFLIFVLCFYLTYLLLYELNNDCRSSLFLATLGAAIGYNFYSNRPEFVLLMFFICLSVWIIPETSKIRKKIRSVYLINQALKSKF